ncbi:hypothetical protein cce_1734 [Crocosphaera subtropica ATCC 51142]|uniref:Uncharacterized protein n=1 Tax=Crocosphaera subtropica (strain ATCC 51142 / BH68) TaxID=43989 RepID=B1WYR7_CROS5|nr:hypothetical protein [Crocosphaera subtropica]ACB51084.1 hypothetical protein cce_1734 [Crocosphaera subtropica ATCC 51142]
MNEQILLNKWQILDPDDQEKVIVFMDVLQQKNFDYLINQKQNWVKNSGN